MMKHIPIVAAALLAATPLQAQDVPLGCYTRDYSQQHLAQNPEQIVDRMSILFTKDDVYMGAHVQVLLADQGHAGRDGYGGMRVSETAGDFIGPLIFGIECDGGSFEVIANTGDSITIETSYFRLAEDGCVDEGIRTSLAESGGGATRYLLHRAENAACDW